MKFFEEREFACKCCGQLPSSVRANIVALVDNVLDPAREQFGGPLAINSGYRCQKYNQEVGGVANSQHMKGEAADVRCSDNRRLARGIVEQGLFDQLILYPTFVHVSYKRNGPNRRQILRKTASGCLKISSSEL